MTGGRDGRSEGSKQLDSGTALFPRLHVAETKRAGPRGPPRNKMALFEQLTIPSHKFKPSPMPLPSTGRAMKSPAMTTPIYLPISQVSGGSQDSMYSYVPMSYMSPTMIPTMACIPSYSYSGLYNAEATNSMNTSGSKSTIVDGGEEPPYDGGSVPKGVGHSKLQAPTKKGRGDDDFAVPTYSSATQSSGQTTRPLSPLHTRIAPRGQRALLRSKGPVVQKQFPSCQEKCMEVTSSEHKDNTGWSTASGECVTVSVAGNEVDSQETDQRELERVPSSESYPTTIPADNVCRVDRLTAMFDHDLLSNIRSESQSGEGSEPSQHTRGSSAETGSSMLENAPAGSVRFQDVVSAFGQREFWKTQMIMIRQQRIFSRQVFELHRVIEVQKLLSKALFSSPSGDEALEKEDDNVHMAESPVARVPEVPQAESPVAEVPEVSLIAEAPSIAEAPQVPEVAERRPELNGANENSRPNVEAPHQPVYPMPAVSTQQAFNREAPWPAPPYPPNPWAVRMSPSFMYVPYPGHYPPGYGAYPMMGASMPMYGTPGAMQQQQQPPPGMPMIFPSWQQPPGMPMVMGPHDSAAMAAWYSQQVPPGQQVPAAAMGASASIAPPSCPRDRLTSSGSGESTSQIAVTRQADRDGAVPSARLVPQEGAVVFNARQADQDGAVQNARQPAQAGASFVFRQGGHDGTAFSARQGGQDGAAFIFRHGGQDGTPLDARQASEDGENSSKRSSGEPRGWAKGWGRRKGRWVRGDRSLLRKNDSDIADLRGNESDSLSGDVARGGGDLGLGGVQPTNECPSVVEPDASSEGRRERFASLKHMRSESAFESGACRWFPILSPSKRPMHHNGVIKVVPRAVSATPELAANILLSIQTDKRL